METARGWEEHDAATSVEDRSDLPGQLEGRIACVTGAAGGLGEGIARALAREGAVVVCADLRDTSEVVSHLPTNGRRPTHRSVHLDVTDPAAIDATMAEVVREYGALDIVVNNAGIEQPIRDVTDTSDAVIDEVLNVNVKGVIYCIRSAARLMRKRGGGSIISIASQAGKIGLHGWGVYCASKFAVVGITEVSALELGPYGVRVNCICPGTMLTDMTRRAHADMAQQQGQRDAESMLRQRAASVPLRRLGTPADAGAMTVWLASDAASFVTGASLNLTGGEQVFF